MSTDIQTDLTGILGLQKGIIGALKTEQENSNKKNSGLPLSYSGEITNVNANLDKYTDSLKSAFESSNAALTHQEHVKQILDWEESRLDSKKQNIDNALQGKQRAAFLNDNYRERFSVYVNLIILVIVTLVILVGLTSLNSIYPGLSFLFNILIFITVALSVLFAYYNVNTLMTRDSIYFDELSLSPPDASGNINYTVDSSGVFMNYELYIGAQYCDNDAGVYFDKSSMLCEDQTKIKEGDKITRDEYIKWATSGKRSDLANFTTLDFAYSSGDMIIQPQATNEKAYTMKEISPYDNIEFSNYKIYS